MSVDIPKMTIAFGQYGIPQADVIECRVHLGCTKEVSSFDLLLQNWNGKYSPNGSVPLAVGMDGYICIGRGTNVPQIITCRIESLKYESSPVENYIRVAGRCWGEKLFRRVFTGVFDNQKGESIVRYLLNYAGLGHTRSGAELVEDTDTTYTHLEYENTPIWDIIRYIADSADKNGVIGFDFRVAPDGQFEFFPRLSKTSPVSLSEKIEVIEYAKDISRIRNCITVYGSNEKKLPSDTNEDGFTEDYTDWYLYYSQHSFDYLYYRSNHVTRDGDKEYTDSYSIVAYVPTGSTPRNKVGYYRVLPSTIKCRFYPDGFKKMRFWFKWVRYGTGSGGIPDPSSVKVILHTDMDNYYYKEIRDLIHVDEWRKVELSLKEYWAPVGSPDWTNITKVGFLMEFPYDIPQDATPFIQLDHLVFEDCRFSAKQQNTNSQNAYGLRELTETDEELRSDNECLLRAKALLDYYSIPAEQLTVKSTVIDYGNTPILPADKIHVTLPNENVDADFRIESVEYRVDARTQTLEITLELGREKPLLADYLYALRSKTDSLSRYKLGKV